jgi:heptosyltransferase-3
MRDLHRIIINRTDSIGDVILTLPLAGMLKRKFPHAELIFLGRSYTREVIEACEHVDRFLNWDEISKLSAADSLKEFKSTGADMIIHVFPRKEIARLAKKAGIPIRMGTTNRLYHWGNCNKLIRLSRRRSELHEAQLNLKLIESISGEDIISKEDIPKLYGFTKIETLEDSFRKLIDPTKYNLILHPKSKGSAREWGVENFIELIKILPEEKYGIFISGTADEGNMLKDTGIFDNKKVTDLTGKMSLGQFMSFIRECDALVAASTGPLHLAAAIGIKAVGIYPPIRPMHPGRWAPIGYKAVYIAKGKDCSDCRNGGECHCMKEIPPEAVKKLLD